MASLNPSGIILIDDYDMIPDVKKAVDNFVKEYGKILKNTYYTKSSRGEYILEF
jgi:hypothetical protein